MDGCIACFTRGLRPGDLPPSVRRPSNTTAVGTNWGCMYRLLKRKAEKLRKETGDDRWRAPMEKMDRSMARTVTQFLYRPILLLVLEPMCLNLCIFSAILLGILYLFFGAFQLVFGNVYGLDLWQRGLCFLGLFVGMAFSIISDPFWRRVYAKLEAKHERAVGVVDDFQPEWRLPPGVYT